MRKITKRSKRNKNNTKLKPRYEGHSIKVNHANNRNTFYVKHRK